MNRRRIAPLIGHFSLLSDSPIRTIPLRPAITLQSILDTEVQEPNDPDGEALKGSPPNRSVAPTSPTSQCRNQRIIVRYTYAMIYRSTGRWGGWSRR